MDVGCVAKLVAAAAAAAAAAMVAASGESGTWISAVPNPTDLRATGDSPPLACRVVQKRGEAYDSASASRAIGQRCSDVVM